MAKRGPEKKFEDALREELEKLGAIVFKLHGSMYQRNLPDCMVAYAGKIILFETKADSAGAENITSSQMFKKCQPMQLYTIKRLRGVRVCVWVVAGNAKTDAGYAVRAGKKTVVKRESIKRLARRILGLIK